MTSMNPGTLVRIFTAPAAGAPMEARDAVRAVPGRGLDGDRYFTGAGSFSRWPGPRREVSLIAEEALAAMARATGIVLPPMDSRRNLLTRGVPLNDLVRTTFTVGPVRMRGIRLCQPCKRLVRLTGHEDTLIPALVDRGGLRAQILNEGVLRPDAPIRLVAASLTTRRTRGQAPPG
jgi:MOSC domain-containing protein YiiM